MINLGKGGQREVSDYKLFRYACYLIAQNGNSNDSYWLPEHRKPI